MDLLTDFFYYEKVLLQGRGGSEATDRPLFGGSKPALSRTILEDAMPFIPVLNTARCAVSYEDNAGNEAANVFHIRQTDGSIDASILSTMADIVENWLEVTWSAFVPTTWRAKQIDLLDLTTEGSFFHSRAIDAQGLDTAEALPSTVTIAISLRSAFSGRSRRGRIYHVGMSDSRVAGDYVTEAAATAYINGYETLRSDLIADNAELVVVSFVSGGVPRVSGLVTPITNITLVDRKVDHQLRRSPN